MIKTKKRKLRLVLIIEKKLLSFIEKKVTGTVD